MNCAQIANIGLFLGWNDEVCVFLLLNTWENGSQPLPAAIWRVWKLILSVDSDSNEGKPLQGKYQTKDFYYISFLSFSFSTYSEFFYIFCSVENMGEGEHNFTFWMKFISVENEVRNSTESAYFVSLHWLLTAL